MSNKPPVVILASGASNRMFPLSSSRVKAMLPMHGKSIMTHALQSLAAGGFHKVIVVISPDTDQNEIKTEAKEHAPSIELEFGIQESATGMGDALLAVKEKLTGQFLVMAPYHLEMNDLADQLLAQEAENVVCTNETATPWRYGIVTTENGLATGITEKPAKGTEKSNQKVQAFYLLNQKFLEILTTEEKDQYSFESALNKLMTSEKVTTIQLNKPLVTVKYPWHLFLFQDQVSANLDSFIADSAVVAKTAVIDEENGPVYLDEGANIGHAARIVGPTYIGKNVRVGDFSLIRNSSIEAGSTIGANTEVVRSIIMEGSSLHFGYLADSIIDREVKIGAGLLTANKRLDRKEVIIKKDDQEILTERQALGIIVGEKSQLGIRVASMPGVLIGSQSKIFPGSILFDSVAEKSTFKK
jgi:UDP-N-acetylglucosamine diphosphorylase / glucose-1-phosphate thymidylyltransferase / UDP-N-acetylgalactosamine diphosphorylase / glucosamine-1-phosphate N-acetyltransferase / galactosamine-1-phosphate N-acetyltransferase